jgi:hypothetical protein
MPNPSQTEFNRRQAINRENNASGNALASGNFTRRLEKQNEPEARAQGRSRAPNAGNLQPQPRASLVERDNEADSVVFHYNPSSYKIGKKANWSEKSAGTGPKTLEWGGAGLTQVSFSILLDDMSHPAKSGGAVMSTEDTLQWLFRRCENRLESQANRRTRSKPRAVSWLNGPSTRGNQEPPVMVLFGLSYPFTCRLTSVDVTTSFQGKNPFTPEPPRNNSIAEFRRIEAEQARQQLGEQPFHIQRATVQITLTEYNAAPQTENKKA